MSQVFKEVQRELEQERLKAEKALASRQEFLYEKLPEIKAIDEELSEIGLHLAKLALRPQAGAPTVATLQERSGELVCHREKLLYDNGYDDAFFDDVFFCLMCKDTGKTKEGHCHCLKQRVIAKYYEMSNLSKVLAQENFDAFNLNYYSDVIDINYGISPKDNMARIWTISHKFVETFDKKFENLLFYGSTGLGKTFLSNCIAKELLDAGKTVLYTTAGQLFKLVEDHRFNRNGAKSPAYLDMITEVDLLIIDDLGTEFPTVVTTSELFSYINARLLNKKSTIISTNLSLSDLEDHYSDRVMSRLFGEYTIMQFFGDDIRVTKKHSY